MLVISNRNLDSNFEKNGVGGGKAFGEDLNNKGPNEVRFANATKEGGNWKVELAQEPKQMNLQNLPSKSEFTKVLNRCKESKKNCLFFVHGYNKPFEETLDHGWRLQQRFGLEVIVFSWPSNTGGFVMKEYKNVKRVAKATVGALDSVFEKLSSYLIMPFDKKSLMECNVKLSLMTYSMGNYVFQNYVNDTLYDGETRMFTNVILCQADCDNENHNKWVESIQTGKRIYITINENDKILGWSDANFQKDRLGNTVRDLNAKNAVYIDFTNGPDVGNTHQVWGEKMNKTATDFFAKVLNSERGEFVEGLKYDPTVNAYRM